MNKLIKNNLLMQGILGVFVVLAVYLSFGLSTIDYKGDMFKYAHVFMCIVSILLYGLFDVVSYNIKEKYNQIFSLNVFLAVVTASLFISGTLDCVINKEFQYYLISKFIFAIFFILLLFRRREAKPVISIRISEYCGLIGVIVSTLILMYSPYFFSFKWDGLLYNEAFNNAELFKISSMGFYGHIAQGAGVPGAFFQCLTLGNTEVAIYLVNAVTLIAGILSFWGIVRRIVPGKSIFLYTILTALYAWSPWALGMSGYASIDYFCANWFLIVLYFTVSKQFYLQVVSGLFYAMTKEPAIIIYGSLCIGVLIVDIYENKGIKAIFSHLRYYGMLSVAAIWLITLKFMGMWSMPGSEAKVEASHLTGQLGILYVFNFSWLIWGIVLVGAIAILVMKRRKSDGGYNLGLLIPMLCAVIAFSLFSLVFVTVPNPRYTDIIPICGYVLAAVFILIISDRIGMAVSSVIAAMLAVLMLVSSYTSVDPVSKALYYDENIKDMVVYTTDVDNHMYGDALVYNKQALNMEGAISAAVSDALSSKRNILINGRPTEVYHFDGMTGGENVSDGEYKWFTEYFDPERKIRMFKSNDIAVSFGVGLVSNLESISKITEADEEYIYLYYMGMGDKLAEDIIDSYKIIENKEYEYCGWKLKGLVFRAD